MKKTLSLVAGAALIASTLALGVPAFAAAPPQWDATGSYVINMEYLGNQYPHDMVLTQDTSGTLTGHGGSPAGANTYTWVVTAGSVSGNTLDLTANYTATADAVTPQTVLHITGTIGANGTLTGTWSDNYQGGTRSGAITTVSGAAAALGVLNAEDFGVVNYDTGLGMLKGYTAGFGIASSTFASTTSVVVKLYAAGDVLLQTNTAILPKFNADITGTQFSSPFDVSGNFDYATDGYWTNVRETQYGQSVPAVKVVATVTLANGKVVMATNTNLTGDPTTIYPAADTTPNAFSFTDQTNVSLNTLTTSNMITVSGISTSTPISVTGGEYSINGGAYATTSGSVVNGDMVRVRHVSSTSYSTAVNTTLTIGGVSDTFTSTTMAQVVTTIPQSKSECMAGGWMNFTNPSFKNQGQCVAYTNHH